MGAMAAATPTRLVRPAGGLVTKTTRENSCTWKTRRPARRKTRIIWSEPSAVATTTHSKHGVVMVTGAVTQDPKLLKMRQPVGTIVMGSPSNCLHQARRDGRQERANDAAHRRLSPHALTPVDDARPMHSYTGVASRTTTSPTSTSS